MHMHPQRETKHYNHAIPDSNHFFAFKNTQNATNIHYSLMAHFGQENQMQENERPGLLLKIEGFSLKVLKKKSVIVRRKCLLLTPFSCSSPTVLSAMKIKNVLRKNAEGNLNKGAFFLRADCKNCKRSLI